MKIVAIGFQLNHHSVWQLSDKLKSGSMICERVLNEFGLEVWGIFSFWIFYQLSVRLRALSSKMKLFYDRKKLWCLSWRFKVWRIIEITNSEAKFFKQFSANFWVVLFNAKKDIYCFENSFPHNSIVENVSPLLLRTEVFV